MWFFMLFRCVVFKYLEKRSLLEFLLSYKLLWRLRMEPLLLKKMA